MRFRMSSRGWRADVDWDDLRVVHAVLRHGSFGAAARALGSTQPTVSRRIDAFERRLGSRLFERGPAGLAPTSLAHALTGSLARMEDAALAAERRLAVGSEGLEGTIRVTSLDWIGDHVVAPIAARFGALHPQVRMELVNDARMYNLSRRDADIAFRFSPFEQEDLVLRKVADVSYGLYAAPSYVARHGLPDFAGGCAGHRLVALDDPIPRVCYRDWLQQLAGEATVVLRTNGLQSQIAVVEDGAAMAALPRLVADARPTLRRIHAPLPEPVQPVRMGVHRDLRGAPRLRAFMDFAVASFRERAAELRPVS